MKKLLQKIAMRLSGLYREDLSTTERQIANLLINAGYLRVNDKDGELEDVETIQERL